jgi:hypothetical protein
VAKLSRASSHVLATGFPQSEGVRYDHHGDPFPILQTMAGIEIDVDSDEVQEWIHSFTQFLPSVIFKAQHKISEILNK